MGIIAAADMSQSNFNRRRTVGIPRSAVRRTGSHHLTGRRLFCRTLTSDPRHPVNMTSARRRRLVKTEAAARTVHVGRRVELAKENARPGKGLRWLSSARPGATAKYQPSSDTFESARSFESSSQPLIDFDRRQLNSIRGDNMWDGLGASVIWYPAARLG